jgi:hypothetical protein
MKSNIPHTAKKWLQETEAKSPEERDDFDKDALNGWQTTGSDFSALKGLDARFVKKSFLGLAGLIFLVLVLSITFGYFIYTSNNQDIEIIKTQVVDKADTDFPEAIDTLHVLQKNKQIAPLILVRNFKSKQKADSLIQVAQTTESNTPAQITEIPVKKVENPMLDQAKEKPANTLTKKLGKEIYVHELKILDYRAYREKPAIKSLQMNALTGTPANLDEKENSSEEETWTQVEVPYHDYIKQTIKQFSKGNYKAALNRSQTILESYPDDLNALFYGGLCAYNLRDSETSIALLSRVLKASFSNFDEEAQWYLAQAFEMKGDKQQAKVIYQQIVDANGYYAKSAMKKLR